MIPTSPLGTIPIPMMLQESLEMLLSPILAPSAHPMYLPRTARTMTATAEMMTAVLPRSPRSTCIPTWMKKKEMNTEVIVSNFCSSFHSQACSANIIPARKAPMIAARPMLSASQDMNRQTMSASASMLTDEGVLPSSLAFLTLLSFHAYILGTTVFAKRMAARTNTQATTITCTTPIMDMPPSDPATPLTMARTIIPRTSSMTAAPMMILDSSLSIRCMSLMTRAVIPTLVATMAAARNMA
ncbi:unknown [Methanoculleus sp. CAG:1088]|nr:unknown [Methanoculleus sp. CAG:1088]